jgi:ABC-type transport system involved in cytochrome c biogenesis ATPase subunit
MAIKKESIGLLLERDGELAQLSLKLKQAGAGQGSVVAIEGPAGMGKTGLLSALHSLAAEQGFRALKARGRDRARCASAFASARCRAPGPGRNGRPRRGPSVGYRARRR